MKDLGVVVNSLVESAVVSLDHIVDKLLYGLLLTFELHNNMKSGQYLGALACDKIFCTLCLGH